MSFMVSPSWHTNWLEEISNIELNHRSATKPSTKSPFSLHLSSSNKHCQDLSNAAGGEMISNSMGPCSDSCSVCLETKWNLAADGCGHEFCTKCALYLSTTNIPQVVPKNNSNKQSMETPSEAFVAYEVEEDRVGVPLLSGLYEVLGKLGLRLIPLCSPLLRLLQCLIIVASKNNVYAYYIYVLEIVTPNAKIVKSNIYMIMVAR
ncbi:unnamed protein product [Brassica oleracea]